MSWFGNWLTKPMIKEDSVGMEQHLKVVQLEQEILRLEKEVVHWKRIALEFKRPH